MSDFVHPLAALPLDPPPQRRGPKMDIKMRIDRKLVADFRAVCEDHDTTPTEVLRWFMDQTVRDWKRRHIPGEEGRRGRKHSTP